MLILFADLIHDKISNTVETLEISSRDESLKNVPFIKNVSSDHNGIHSTLDLNKRNLLKISSNETKILQAFSLCYQMEISIWENHRGIKSSFQELILLIENGIKELSKMIKPTLVQFSCLLL